ncbi:MAG: RagB/SusD family nutrient uptake outer membrane protein, partial [Prevotellaceae bacterium]|nr:RagB/SusD family nutrient uptake outer membrane protein [Prevotellaceae bacterium]
SDGWVPIIRYAEILLNKAEALVKSTNTVNADAITLLNQVHQRSEPGKVYETSDFANATALLNEIMTERRRELAFEGHSSFDLFRNEKGIPAGRGGASVPEMTYPDNYFALPIPNGDVEKAKGVLEQNKGY